MPHFVAHPDLEAVEYRYHLEGAEVSDENDLAAQTTHAESSYSGQMLEMPWGWYGIRKAGSLVTLTERTVRGRKKGCWCLNGKQLNLLLR